MKKVLIWDISFKLANVGGPAGYLYNIHEYLKLHPSPQITFLSDLLSEKRQLQDVQNTPAHQSLKARLLNNSFIKNANEFFSIIWRGYHHTSVRLPKNLDLSQYDYIHVHRVDDAIRHKSILKGFRGKIICTNHCPCLLTDEIIANRGGIYKFFRSQMKREELRAYKSADYLMFPCKGAREPYEKDKDCFVAFHAMENKFFYCPSSIMDLPVDENVMQKYSDLGIPKDAFVITYFGRHNEVKGYDILKRVGSLLLEKYPNLYFVCAGKGPIEPLEHPRWIELGFIQNTHELLWQSDLYILPNRETYFDLIVLEVLRSRTPLILSANGGNNYFKSLPKNEIGGLSFFNVEDLDSLIGLTSKHIEEKRDNKQLYLTKGESNRKLWNKYFTIESYINRYLFEIDGLN